VQRSRMGAEQLLSAAGHGDAAIHEAIDAIVRAAESSVSPQPASGRESPVAVPSAAPEPEAEPEPEPKAEAEPSDEEPAEDTSDAAPEEERPQNP
jgi:hypothetical protein